MSLVSEALRKARAQQLRQAAEGGQLPPAVAPVPQRKRGLSLLLVVSLLSGLAGASLVALFWPRPPVVPQPPAASPPLPSPQPAGVVNPAVPLPTPAPLPNPVPARPLSPEERPLQASPAPTEPPLPGVPQPGPTPEAKPSPPQEFVVNAKLTGTVLTLDFLVYGPTRSFARINGQEVVEGSTVAGFVVEKILEDRVILRQGQETVVLKTR